MRSTAALRRVLLPGGRLCVVERVQLPGTRRVHHAVDGAWADLLARSAESIGFGEVSVESHGAGRDRRIVVAATC